MTAVPAQKPIVLGITGTISSGKNAVGKILEEQGIPVFDTDDIVNLDLYVSNEPLKQLLAENFGVGVIDTAAGRVNNKALRDIVFNDEQKLTLLDKLVHPFVETRIEEIIAEQAQNAQRLIAFLVPKLFESKSERFYDETWAVVVRPIDKLIQRLIDRTWSKKQIRLTSEEAQRWMSRQWSQDEKATKATHEVDNSGSLDDLKQNTLAALSRLKQTFGLP